MDGTAWARTLACSPIVGYSSGLTAADVPAGGAAAEAEAGEAEAGAAAAAAAERAEPRATRAEPRAARPVRPVRVEAAGGGYTHTLDRADNIVEADLEEG